ncbi:hypothetical protein NMG60_11007775 [Bertholletia excelsa]
MDTSVNHIRSTSLPCKSHPSMVRIEEDLKKLKTWKPSASPTAEEICIGLMGLEKLYKKVDELLNLPLTQQAFALHRNGRWFDESLDVSVRLLDVCGVASDAMSQIKEHKMNKETKKSISGLKQMGNKIEASSPILEIDDKVIRVLTDVGEISILVYHSVLLFLSTPTSKPNPRRQSLVSRLFHKGRIACESQEENANEMESLDVALNRLCRCASSEGDEVKLAKNSLKNLEDSIESVQNSLDCSFRRLIRARTSLLNIGSQ